MENKAKTQEISRVKDLFGINEREIDTEKTLKEIDRLFNSS
mgnify:CR=1 FL=1